jgi:hypothetical protein
MPMLDTVFFALTFAGTGFVAGYATRAKISRKRRAEYLLHEPYLPRMMKVEAEPAEETDDLARDSGGAFLHPPGAEASPAVSGADQERLHDLLRRAQREVQDKSLPRRPAR